MNITIDTSQPLTDTEKAILRILLGEDSGVTINQTITETPKPAPKTRAKPKAEPAEETPEETKVLTVEDVAKLAQSKMTSGHREQVKAALDEVGVTKVRELEGTQIEQFYKILQG